MSKKTDFKCIVRRIGEGSQIQWSVTKNDIFVGQGKASENLLEDSLATAFIEMKAIMGDNCTFSFHFDLRKESERKQI